MPAIAVRPVRSTATRAFTVNAAIKPAELRPWDRNKTSVIFRAMRE
jgi:hypothetical protein